MGLCVRRCISNMRSYTLVSQSAVADTLKAVVAVCSDVMVNKMTFRIEDDRNILTSAISAEQAGIENAMSLQIVALSLSGHNVAK